MMSDINLQKDSRWADYFAVINFITKTLYPSVPFPRGYFEAESAYFKEAVLNFDNGKPVIRVTEDDLMRAVYCIYPLIPGTLEISPAVTELMAELERKYPASILPLIVKGKFYLAAKNYPAAKQFFSEARLLDAECVPAFTGLAQIAYAQGQYEESASLLDSVWKQLNPTEANYTLWVDLSLKKKEYPVALSKIDKALSAYSSSPSLMVKKSLILLSMGEWDKLKQFFPKIAIFDGMYPEVLLIKGLLALEHEDGVAEASDCLKRGRALFPGYADYRFLEGRIALASGDFKKGRSLLLSSDTVLLDPQLLYLAVFEAGVDSGNFPEAVESLAKIDLSKQDGVFLEKAARVCLYAKDYDRAVFMSRKLLELDDSGENRFLLIEALSRQGKDASIPGKIETALAEKDLFPAHQARLLFAKSLWYKDVNAKIGLLQSARAADPYNPDVLYELAILEIRMGRSYNAWFLLKQLVESVPDYPGAKAAFEALPAGFFDENEDQVP
jgi:tetratricopeptide (TPR) repeat protein